MKTTKRYIIKFVAVIISTIYVISPIHNEVKKVLHSISHSLEMFDITMSHHYKKHQAIRYKKATTSTEHRHQIIDALDFLFGGNTTKKDSKEPYNLVDKLDKHISSSNDIKTKFNLSITQSANDNYLELKKEIFYKKIKIPPKMNVSNNLVNCT